MFNLRGQSICSPHVTGVVSSLGCLMSPGCWRWVNSFSRIGFSMQAQAHYHDRWYQSLKDGVAPLYLYSSNIFSPCSINVLRIYQLCCFYTILEACCCRILWKNISAACFTISYTIKSWMKYMFSFTHEPAWWGLQCNKWVQDTVNQLFNSP